MRDATARTRSEIARAFTQRWQRRTKAEATDDYLGTLAQEHLTALTAVDLVTLMSYDGVFITKQFADNALRKWQPRKHTGRQSYSTWTVYRYYDAEGQLLYVGATGQGHWRSRAHNKTARWWPLVARAEFEHFATEDEAFSRELEQIATLNPIYNIADRVDNSDTAR